MQLLKVPADCHGFADAGAVIQFQHGHYAERVLGQKLGRRILARLHVDGDGLDIKTFLGQIDAHAAGVGGAG